MFVKRKPDPEQPSATEVLQAYLSSIASQRYERAWQCHSSVVDEVNFSTPTLRAMGITELRVSRLKYQNEEYNTDVAWITDGAVYSLGVGFPDVSGDARTIIYTAHDGEGKHTATGDDRRVAAATEYALHLLGQVAAEGGVPIPSYPQFAEHYREAWTESQQSVDDSEPKSSLG